MVGGLTAGAIHFAISGRKEITHTKVLGFN
jgi:hypothetical protein